MNKKIMFYASGSFARILKYIPHFIKDYEFYAFCPNYNSQQTCLNSKSIIDHKYLFEDFNNIFKNLDFNKSIEKLFFLNLAKIHFADKSSYKKFNGNYQEHYMLCTSQIIFDYLNNVKPDYIFFPIIESTDAMIAFEIAKYLNIKTICYSHGRLINKSFFSSSYNETLPEYYKEIKSNQRNEIEAKNIVQNFRNNPIPLKYKYDSSSTDILVDEIQDNALKRLFLAFKNKYTIEKHNKFLKIWVKILVFFERLVVPLESFFYSFIEKYYLKSVKTIPENFIFFPLHFSPESSINTPSPFYIDQIRVIDKILLTKEDNSLLIIKEHPAMFNKRSLSFYNQINKIPFVKIINKEISSIEILKKCSKVYSVTGTVCMEAFFLEKDWEQFGENFLSSWIRENKDVKIKDRPFKFTEDVLNVSSDFMLYSPSNNKERNNLLFSYSNVKKMSGLNILINNVFNF